MNHQKTNVLGVGISAINIPLAVQTIDDWIETKQKNYVCVTGVHGVMESQYDNELRQIHNNAGMVTPDGMPMVWLSKLAGNKHVDRVYGPDLMLEVCQHSVAKGYRHYFYGGAEGVAEKLIAQLTTKNPGMQIAGSYCPPFRPLTPEEDAAVIQEINDSKADIVWVGLSTPKQERWMNAHIGKLDAPVMLGVGAAFDFHAGLKKQAPYWMQRNGLEWFFRLVTEPRRLWKRYLQNNPRFVALVIGQWMGLKKYEI